MQPKMRSDAGMHSRVPLRPRLENVKMHKHKNIVPNAPQMRFEYRYTRRRQPQTTNYKSNIRGYYGHATDVHFATERI